jgi:CheY-like chemotaxis protein
VRDLAAHEGPIHHRGPVARILLIDDDIAEISAVKRVLARASLAPVLATNASDAQAALTQRPADLLLVGATCEGGEAILLARRLEEDEATRGLPLIVLGTAPEAPAHAVQLPRPIDPAALAEQVQLLLAARRMAPAVPPRPATSSAAVPPAGVIGRAAAPALDPSPPPASAPAAPAPPPAPPAAPPSDPAARTAFERRGPPIVLPDPLERRAQPSDPANARRAAAEALRARAAELRRAPAPEPAPAAAEAAAGLDALFELAPPAGVEAEAQPAGVEAEAPPVEADPLAEPPAPAWSEPPPEYPAELEAVAVPASPEDPAASWFEQPPAAPDQTAGAGAAAEADPVDPAAGWFEAAGADGPIAETPFDLPPEPELTSAMFEEPLPPADADGVASQEEPAAAEAWSAPPATAASLEEPPRRIVDEMEERARAEEALAAEAEARRARLAEQLARTEAQARVQAARLAESEAARAREAEERARVEAGARAEAARQAEQAAARAREAEAAAREEAEARRLLEAELGRLRAQLDASQEAHQAELKSAVERTAAEEQAVAALRLHEARQATGVAVEEAASEATRRAQAEAQRASSDALEALRAQAEAEAARRAEAEAALARLSEEASRLAAERAALVEAAAAAAQAAALAPPAGVSEPPVGPATAATPAAPALAPALATSLADLPPPDAAQEAARRRALSLRQRREPAEAPAPPAWSTPFEPPPAYAAPAPATEPHEPEHEPAPTPPATPPAELRGGNLEDLPAPRLLALAAQARLGGRLDVTGDGARSLWFEDGRLAGAASNVPGERIEEVALRLGLLTREQHRQVAGAAAALASRRAALLLVDRGYLKPAELTALVRRRTEEVAFGLFADGQARFRWVPDQVPPDERVATDRPTLALAVEGVRRRWLAPRADLVLGGPASLLAPAASGPPAGELGLTVDERRLLALADGLRTLDEVLALSPLDALSTRQVLAAAVLTGALTVRVVHAGRTAAQVTAAIDLARVREKLDQVRRADYFTILGIGRVCTPHEVREAADRLTAEFAAERFQGAREEGLAARLEEIRRVVAEAREVLAEDALRAEYLRGLPG